MAEYIEREAFKKSAEERYCKPCKAEGKDYNGCRCRACWVDDMLDEVECFQPSDVAPVVHGRWIGIDSSFWKPTHRGDIPVFRKTYRCSECRRRTAIAENYCPNCGAKMDKEEADDKKQPEEAPGE